MASILFTSRSQRETLREAEIWIRAASISGLLVVNSFNLLRLAILHRNSSWRKITARSARLGGPKSGPDRAVLHPPFSAHALDFRWEAGQQNLLQRPSTDRLAVLRRLSGWRCGVSHRLVYPRHENERRDTKSRTAVCHDWRCCARRNGDVHVRSTGRCSSAGPACCKRTSRCVPHRYLQSNHRLRDRDSEDHGCWLFLTSPDGIRRINGVPFAPLCVSLVARCQRFCPHHRRSKSSLGAHRWRSGGRFCDGPRAWRFPVASESPFRWYPPDGFPGDNESGGGDPALGHDLGGFARALWPHNRTSCRYRKSFHSPVGAGILRATIPHCANGTAHRPIGAASRSGSHRPPRADQGTDRLG